MPETLFMIDELTTLQPFLGAWTLVITAASFLVREVCSRSWRRPQAWHEDQAWGVQLQDGSHLSTDTIVAGSQPRLRCLLPYLVQQEFWALPGLSSCSLWATEVVFLLQIFIIASDN